MLEEEETRSSVFTSIFPNFSLFLLAKVIYLHNCSKSLPLIPLHRSSYVHHSCSLSRIGNTRYGSVEYEFLVLFLVRCEKRREKREMLLSVLFDSKIIRFVKAERPEAAYRERKMLAWKRISIRATAREIPLTNLSIELTRYLSQVSR